MELCNGPRVFRHAGGEAQELKARGWKFIYLAYLCWSCQKTEEHFSLAAQGRTVPASNPTEACGTRRSSVRTEQTVLQSPKGCRVPPRNRWLEARRNVFEMVRKLAEEIR